MIIFQAYQFYKIPQQSCLSKNVKYCPLSNWRVYTKLSLLQCIQHEHSIQQDTMYGAQTCALGMFTNKICV